MITCIYVISGIIQGRVNICLISRKKLFPSIFKSVGMVIALSDHAKLYGLLPRILFRIVRIIVWITPQFIRISQYCTSLRRLCPVLFCSQMVTDLFLKLHSIF